MTRTRLIHYVLLAVAVLAVFGQACGHYFVTWDDGSLIYKNPNVTPPTWHGLAEDWRGPQKDMYIPLVYSAWWGLAHVAQVDHPDEYGAKLNPFVFHAANIILHLLSVWLVYEILLLLAKEPRAALAGAMLFAVHPVQVEAVAWATGMKDVLCGMLCLAALWQYILADRRGRYAMATILFALALLAKPSAVTLPLAAGVIDWLILRRTPGRIIRCLAPWLAMAIAFAIIAALAQPPQGVDGGPLWARPFIAADSLAFYLYKIIFPLWLTFDYGRRPAVVIANHYLYFTWLLPAAAAIFIWKLRQPLVTTGGLILIISLAPVLGLVTFVFQFFSTVADRYLYFAMLGPALMLAWLVAKYPGRRTAALCGSFLGILAVLAIAQTSTWRDNPTLFTHAIEVNPKSFVAHADLGADKQFHRDWEGAVREYKTSLQINPIQSVTYDYLIELLRRLHRPNEAADWTRRLMGVQGQLPPSMRFSEADMRMTLGLIDLEKPDMDDAIAQFQYVLKLDPGNAEAQRQLRAAQASGH